MLVTYGHTDTDTHGHHKKPRSAELGRLKNAMNDPPPPPKKKHHCKINHTPYM